MENRKRNFTKVQRQRFVATAFCLLTMMASSARGQELDSAVAMMTDGDFLKAAKIAARIESSEGFTLAARALAIYGYEIASKWWLSQFKGKKEGRRMEYKHDINGLSGATISAKSITDSVKILSKNMFFWKYMDMI